jgi:hypothetical protein
MIGDELTCCEGCAQSARRGDSQSSAMGHRGGATTRTKHGSKSFKKQAPNKERHAKKNHPNL